MSVIRKNHSYFPLSMEHFFKHPKNIKKYILLGLVFVSFAISSFAQTSSCNCKEYIYLNEPVIGTVLKFEVGVGVPLTEVTGTNGPGHWYPGSGVSQLPSPHGLGTDLNGNLYIGSSYDVNTPIRKFNCDGQIEPLGPTTINNQFILTNMFSIGNTIYTTRSGGPAAYNSCTGALIGTMCLNDQNGNPLPNINGTVGSQMNWGLSYNAVTQKVYATGVTSPRQSVWVFTKNQLDAGIAGGSCISPLIPLGTTSVINPGDNFLPNNIEDLRGVVSDNAGNIYVTGWYAGNVGFILKYNAAGQFQAAATTSSSYQLTVGIIWSETTNRIYVSNGADDPTVDCISAFDANTLAYLGAAAPNPNLPTNNGGKAIAIIKECCPVNLPSTFQRNVCGAVGSKFYLNQEAFNDCDGTVCGSSWTPSSLVGMTFDPCDNSVTITGSAGCSTFSLNIGAVTSTGCGAQNATFTICNILPTVTALPTTCNPNNNQYAVSGQVTFVDPPTSGTLTVSISGGGTQVFNAPFISPLNYTINGQVSDGLMKTVTATFSALLSCTNSTTYMAPSGCAPTGTCGCTEYIYLNEPEAKKVLKFRVGSNVPLTEIPGQGGGPWYPGTNISELPFPHGIATDLNGFLYIAERSQDGYIRKLNCDGDIFPVSGTTVNNTGVHTNMFSIGNTLYVTGLGGPKAYDLCTGDLLGQMCLSDANGVQVSGTPWGLSYNAVTETVYASGLTGNRIWAFSRAQLEAGIAGTGACITPLIQQGPNATVNIGENFTPNAATGVFGVVGDDSGNIYVVESAVVGGTGTYVLKYDVNGLLLATSPVDNVLGGGGYYYGMGMVWSETSNRLYVSNRTNDLTEDCIAAFDAGTMAYLGPGAPNPLVGTGPTSGKALGIIKECCPINLPSTFTREVCGAVGTKFYLNVEAFNDCDGTVCGSSWTPTSLTGMTFDPCDNSVTVTGPGCGIFTLDIGAVTSTSCPAQMSTFTICNLIPSGTAVANMGTCSGATANNDARVNLSSITNADQAGISIGATYTGPSYGGVGTINVSSGSGVFNNLMHNTTYTVRIFNASGTCYVDRTVITPVVVCCASSVRATPSACNPNNNQYTVTGQVTINNGPSTGTLTVSITGGSSQVFNAPFASPISYSIGGQTSDGLVKTVTTTFSAVPTCGNTVTYTAPSNCSPTTTCNCTEYVYLNEPNNNSVLKFKVSGAIALSEMVGSNGGPHWYPGSGISQIPGPHGLGTDLNGNLYIGASGINDYIRKLDCDGNLTPISGNSVFNPGTHQNIFSIDNTLYVNTDGGPSAYNLCTGTKIGQMCLNGAGGNLWGLSYNPVTQLVYASQRSGSQQVWVFTRAQLEAGIAGGPCINPIITLGPNAVVNAGENFLPNAPGGVFGVVGDNNGNIYVVKSAVDGGTATYILKYNAAGQFISKTLDGICGSATTPYCFGIGVVWSEDTNRLYMSNLTDDPTVDCISAFDAGTMAYIGTAAPNPNLPTNSTGKAIAIIKECCPVNLPSAFQREVCGAVGTKFYLNEQAFDDCDGTVCGSSWTPSSLNGMTFDPCDNSVTVTGVGCSTFTLGIGGVASTGCAPQNSTFTICNNLPSASFTPISGTCNATGPNNDARVNVINATYANQAGISVGNTYTGPAYGAMGTISLAGGSGTFTGLMHVTAYTIRVFNGSNECYVDFQVNTPSLECCNISTIVPQNIVCYDNDTPNKLSDNKIRFSANVTNSNALLTTYNVSIRGGTTITPNTNVPYGTTQFTLGAGTAGGGATFTITFTDSQTPGCIEVLTITDPGNCTPGNPPTPCPPIQCGTATIQVNGN